MKDKAGPLDTFLQFARNQRWGTCGVCPRDENGHAYPERCRHYDRYDHKLDINDLCDYYKRKMAQ